MLPPIQQIRYHKPCLSFISHFLAANDCFCGSVQVGPTAQTLWEADIIDQSVSRYDSFDNAAFNSS